MFIHGRLLDTNWSNNLIQSLNSLSKSGTQKKKGSFAN